MRLLTKRRRVSAREVIPAINVKRVSLDSLSAIADSVPATRTLPAACRERARHARHAKRAILHLVDRRRATRAPLAGIAGSTLRPISAAYVFNVKGISSLMKARRRANRASRINSPRPDRASASRALPARTGQKTSCFARSPRAKKEETKS